MDDQVEKIISFLPKYEQDRINITYIKNKEIILKENRMMIIGHDIFKTLINFLRSKKIYIKDKDLYEYSYVLDVPDDFIENYERVLANKKNNERIL